MKQKNMIDMAADRGAFIDQSQSLNIFMEAPSFGKLTSMHFYCWRKGLKTGMCVSSCSRASLHTRLSIHTKGTADQHAKQTTAPHRMQLFCASGC